MSALKRASKKLTHARRPVRPVDKPHEFALSAQRACMDDHSRWMWYYSNFNQSTSRRIHGHSGKDVASWCRYVGDVVTDQAMKLFNSEEDMNAMNAYRAKLGNENLKQYHAWRKETLEMIEESSTSREGLPALNNPYAECLGSIASDMRPHHPLWFFRRALSEAYSLAVPTTKAVHIIAEAAPKILECGTNSSGYWSHLLSQAGADVKLLNKGRPHYPGDVWQWPLLDPETKSEEQTSKRTAYDVRCGDHLSEKPGRDDDRALLYVWPLHLEGSAFWSTQPTSSTNSVFLPSRNLFPELNHWNGNTLVVIAPTSSDGDLLNAEGAVKRITIDGSDISAAVGSNHNGWNLMKTINIPTWPGFTDRVLIFKR